jgi:hypothetical protein
MELVIVAVWMRAYGIETAKGRHRRAGLLNPLKCIPIKLIKLRLVEIPANFKKR